MGFRLFALQEASRRGLTGWVRNRGEDQVEVVAEGPEDQLQALLEALRAGPPRAWVQGVDTSWQAATGEFTDFSARASSWK